MFTKIDPSCFSIDVVIPLFDEEKGLDIFFKDLLKVFDDSPFKVRRYLLVDDGSSDQTLLKLKNWEQLRKDVIVITLLGNHGHQKALVAGLDASDADLVLMMDGDGQHPPRHAIKLMEAYLEDPSLDVVQAVRHGNQPGFCKNIFSNLFYSITRRMSPGLRLEQGVSDFRLMSREAVDILLCFPDRYRNLRVLLATLRLRTQYVPYQVADRIAGSSGYSFLKMMRLAADGWFAFSMVPLKLSLFLSLVSGLACLMYGFYVLAAYVLGHTVPGWASVIILLLGMFTVVFLVLAIISEYVARIYEDTRDHPVYLVRRDGNVERSKQITEN